MQLLARRATPGQLTAIRVALVAAAYYLAARASIELPVSQDQLSPIWIPAGIVLAATLVWGRWMVLGAFLGEGLAVLVGLPAPFIAFGISAGNALDPLLAVTLMRALDVRVTLARTRDVLWFTAIAALTPALSATTTGNRSAPSRRAR